jgi:hypothetical protein
MPAKRASLVGHGEWVVDEVSGRDNDPVRAKDVIKGTSTTKASPLLRSSIRPARAGPVRKAGDEVEAEPGFFEDDTVAHCGP